jgi:hypothetical protein
MKFLITITLNGDETISLFAESETNARIACTLIAAHVAVSGITIHEQLKSGLKLIQEWGHR